MRNERYVYTWKYNLDIILLQPQREKTYFLTCAYNEDCSIWSESWLSAWRTFASLAIKIAPQWRFWSDCANAQAGLNLRWTHMSEGMFSDVAAHMRNARKQPLCPMWTAKIRSAGANNASPCLFVRILVFYCILRTCNRTKRLWVDWPCVNEQSDLYVVALWYLRMDTLHRCKKSLCLLLKSG